MFPLVALPVTNATRTNIVESQIFIHHLAPKNSRKREQTVSPKNLIYAKFFSVDLFDGVMITIKGGTTRLRKSILEVHGMRCARLVATTLLGMLLCTLPAVYLTGPVVRAAQAKTEKKEVRVWVNTNSGVYHCPGTRWYGKTKQGKYMSECEAIKDGNRPAYGKACGSDCK
jgi:hypothetical protein